MGFGREVHSYLAHYVNVADAKAGATVAAALGVLAFAFHDGASGMASYVLLVTCTVSLVASILAVFPRMPRGRQGGIFWEDIRNHGSADAYVQALGRLASPEVENDYGHQNYHVSRVLHWKMFCVKWALVFLGIELLAAMRIAWGA